MESLLIGGVLLASGAVMFPLAFVGIWLAVTFLLATTSGWSALRREHPDPGPEPTRWQPVRVGYLGGVRFRGSVMSIGASPAGLHLKTGFLFASAHQPIRVPWALVRVGEVGTLLWETSRVLSLGANGVSFKLSDAEWQKVQADAVGLGVAL